MSSSVPVVRVPALTSSSNVTQRPLKPSWPHFRFGCHGFIRHFSIVATGAHATPRAVSEPSSRGPDRLPGRLARHHRPRHGAVGLAARMARGAPRVDAAELRASRRSSRGPAAARGPRATAARRSRRSRPAGGTWRRAQAEGGGREPRELRGNDR